MSATAVAHRLGVSARRLRRYTAEGRLPDARSAGGLPLGAAFAALTLGFLADGEQQLYRAGRWFRLSGARGHVLARTGSGL